MSSVDVDLVLRTARLARLELSAAEAERLAPQFERILAAFRVLAQVELAGVDPLVTPGEPCDVLRDDLPRPGLDRAALLERAPQHEDGFFRAPRTIGDEA